MVSSHQKQSGPLSEIQISLLRLFDQNLSESETLEVRKMLMDHFDKGLQNELKKVVEEKKYSEEDYHKMLSDDNFMTK
ncbi:hypothetical protein [Dyadobacter sp. CY312]|uniref:hypothetical protein n=1 Tax=Dyadobacter sp. CY312 TaxID=2907303 RepID=UPI001F36BE71|nr:hypothetical protein [Dyadobacter sp. CY312]MCE7040656.1 hypothetical protein [Dyadobacter sp. CY312]